MAIRNISTKIFAVIVLVFIALVLHPLLARGAISTPTQLTTTNSGSVQVASLTTGSITPTGGALLLVMYGSLRNGGGVTHTISDTFSDTITWTQITDNNGFVRGSLFYGTGYSSGSGTVTVTNSSNARSTIIVDELTGHDATTPISESNTTNQPNGTTMSISLTSIAAGNITWGGLANRSGSAITPGTNETEIGEGGDGASNRAYLQTEHGTETTVDWSALNSDDSAGIAIEIAEAPGAGNSTPSISNLSLNDGSDISLIESTFKWASSTMAITDADGCDEVATTTGGASVSAIAYLASSTDNSTTCTYDGNKCYPTTLCMATSTNTCTPGGVDTTVDYECGFKIWYTAIPTDTGARVADEWSVTATTTDKFYATTTATNAETVDVNTLLAIDMTGSIAYGSVDQGANTGVTNQISTTTNTGNADLDVNVGGDNMTSGANILSYIQQKYSTTTFTYSTEGTGLTASITPVGVVLDGLVKPTSTTTPIEDTIYWGIGIPGAQATGSYTGTNYFTACASGSCNAAFEFDYLFSDGTDVFYNYIGGGSAVNIDNASDFGTLNSEGQRLVRTTGGNLYAFLNDGGSCEVWRSIDDGVTWSEQDDTANPACNTLAGRETATMAIDSSGVLHLVYTDDTDGTIARYRTFSTATDSFTGSEETIYDTTNIQMRNVNIAIDSNDVPHVVVLDTVSASDADIVYINRTSGSWQTPVTVEDPGTILLVSASIAISEDDIPEIAYINVDDGDLTAAVGDDNNPTAGQWTLHDVDTDVESGSTNIRGAPIAIDSSGNTWIGYIDNDVTTDNIVSLVKHNDADGWTTWQTRVTNTNVGNEPSVAIDGTDVYIFYEDDGADVAYDVYDGSTWDGETILDTGTTLVDVRAKWQFNNNN